MKGWLEERGLFERYDIVETCNSLRDACKWKLIRINYGHRYRHYAPSGNEKNAIISRYLAIKSFSLSYFIRDYRCSRAI